MQFFSSIQSKKWQLAGFLCLLAGLPSIAQSVENVRTKFDQSRQLMLIYYDIKRLNYKEEIRITPYLPGEDSSATSIKSLSGDFGWIKRSGKNKLMIWDPFNDGVNSLGGIQISLKTELRQALVPRYWYACLHGSNSAPLGIKLARLNRVGFFASFRMGKLPPASQYKVNNAGVIANYLESGVYEIGTKRRLASYAITVGPVFQLTRNLHAYAGGGYGVEQLFWQYQSYNLDRELTGSNWALNENINSSGFAADAGIILQLGRMVFDLGMSIIQFKSFQVVGSVGYLFKVTPPKGFTPVTF